MKFFVNAANVTNIEVITALTSTNLRSSPGSGVQLAELTVTSIGSSSVRQPRVQQPISRPRTGIAGGSTSGGGFSGGGY
jgi:uncharacterized membrane protein